MSFAAKVITHSIADCDWNNREIATVTATYPRFIHSEILTHRDRARNSASSRAIPWKKIRKDGSGLVDNCMMNMVMSTPVVPLSFDTEQSGGGETINQDAARKIWLQARDSAVHYADQLATLGVHKSLVNRIVEPWMWITVIMTATEWKNFFRLRVHPAAEKHFQKIAGMIKDALAASTPVKLKPGQWHLPYFELTDGIEIARRGLQYIDTRIPQKISTGRCARVSFLTHEGVRDISEDIRLAEQLINPPSAGLDEDVMHASPLEHPAECMEHGERSSGPFRGWKQFRKEFAKENVEG